MFSNAKFIYENSRGKFIEFSLQSPFKVYIDGIDDLSHNNVSITETTVVNQVGTTIQSQSVESKSITVNGNIDSDIRNNREIMIETIIPNDNAKFYYINNDEKWYLDVVPINTPYITNHEESEDFQFIMKAPYPFWKSADGSNVITFGSFTSTYQYPQSFSNSQIWYVAIKNSSVISNIINDSPYDVGMKVIMKCTGNVVNPYIINTTTQERIEINTEKHQMNTEGHSFIISTEENDKYIKVVYPDGMEKYDIDLMGDTMTFFKLYPGDNPIRYGAFNHADGLEIHIQFNDLKVGV